MPNLIQQFLRILIQKVRTIEKFYVVIDNSTGFPFIDEHADDCIWLFSTEQYANDAVEHYTESYRNFRVQPIENKDLGNFAEDLYLNGIYGVYIDNGYASCILKKEDLFPIQMEEAKEDPIMNPDFMLAHLEMVQEASWKVDYEERPTILKSLEKEVAKQILNAEFLVPVNASEVEEGTVENAKLDIPCLEGKDGREAIPVFTDWKQFKFAYSGDDYKGLLITYDHIANFIKDGKPVVINVGSCFLELNENNIKGIEAIANEE